MPTKTHKSSKNDVLLVEKRVIDLELGLDELKETVQKIDVSGIPELTQKVSEIEDLIMVEQAAVLELKKMLEKGQPDTLPIPEELDNRIKSMETSIPNFLEKTEFESKLDVIQKDVAELTAKPASVEMENVYSRLSGIESTLAELKSQ